MTQGPAAGDYQELARVLNEARQRLGLTIRAAARVAGVPTATAQGWLNGQHQPTPALRGNFFQLVDGLGLTGIIDENWWVDSAYARVAPQLRDGHAPYLGLRPYSADDLGLFFGRGQAVEELAAAVTRVAAGPVPRIVVLVGASGSGKSSLLAAGLAQALQPGKSLAGYELRQIPLGGLPGADAADFHAQQLVVVDQFEDVFHQAAPARTGVLRAIEAVAGTATVVIGLRADAFAQASLEPVLARALSRPVLLAPLTTTELEQAITEPALSQRVVVEDKLLTVLMNDLVPGAGTTIAPAVLPLVSTALLFTWAAGTGSRMTLADYLSVGGVARAVEQLADGVLESLTTSQQQLTEQLFLRLVAIEADSIFCGSLPLASLDAAAREVVDAFADARLLTLTESDVRISHEALLRHWPRLSQWIEDGRERLFVLQQLKRAAQLWLDDERDAESLIPARRLPLFQSLVEEEPDAGPLLTADERAFVAASAAQVDSVRESERRINARLRRRERVAVALAAIAVALAMIAGVLYAQSQQAQVASAAAEAAAQSRQVAVAAQQAGSEDPNLQARLALVADSLSNTVEARSALGDATSVYAPLRWAGDGPAFMAVSPDQKVVARADGAGRVTLWRGDELLKNAGATFDADPNGVPLAAVAIAQVGGRILLALAGEGTAALWDITAEPTHLTTLDGKEWSAVAFSPSGDTVAFGNRRGGVSLVSVVAVTGSAVATIRTTVELPKDTPDELVSVRSILFDHEGGILFVGGKAHAICRWQVTGVELTALTPIRYDNVRPALSLALSPSGDQLVAGLMSRRILRWQVDGDTYTPLTELGGFLSNVNDVEFTADGTRLLVAGDDHGTYVLDPASGEQQARLNGPSAINSVGLVLDGLIATADGNGDLRIWPSQDPLLRTNGSTGYRFSVDRAGHWLALATDYDGVVLWNTSDDGFRRMPAPAVTFPPRADGTNEAVASGVAVDPQGRFLVAGTDSGDVVTWPLTDSGAGTPSVVSAVPGQDLGFMAINPAGDLVAGVPVNDGSEVALLRADATGELTKVGAIPTRSPRGASFSPDGTLLAIPRSPGQIELWSVTDPALPTLAGTVLTATQPTVVVFAPTAPLLATAETSGEVAIVDVANPAAPREVRRSREPRSEVSGLNWSPDGTSLLASGGDEHVWQWDTTHPEVAAVASYSGGMGRTNDIAFVHGGRQFVATGATGDVRVWIAGRDDARKHLCTSQGSPLSDTERAERLRGVPLTDPCRGIS